MTVTVGSNAPREGCDCEVCLWLREERPQDIDLRLNYEKYLRGELVAKDSAE